MTLQDIWHRLLAVTRLQFDAQSSADSGTGWNGRGTGVVRVEILDSATILFHESGSWRQQSGEDIGFRNVFRWSINTAEGLIRLEHLRFGPDRPVHLLICPSWVTACSRRQNRTSVARTTTADECNSARRPCNSIGR